MHSRHVICSAFESGLVIDIRRWFILLLICVPFAAHGTKSFTWRDVSAAALVKVDDDIRRNIQTPRYFDGIEISEQRFVENGFAWQLVRFASKEKRSGPLWMVPHDDENAGFDAMIAAIKMHGGVGIAVNSGSGGLRRQSGNGICGVNPAKVTSCDPNRNFSDATPKFTSAFLAERKAGHPVIALHTNTPGFSGDGQGGRGEITILDAAEFSRGVTVPRRGGHLAIEAKAEMANYDNLGLTAYLASNGQPDADAVACRNAMVRSGVHFWHERVGTSDGSMSNYLALKRPEIKYFNAESRNERDLAVAAARFRIMVWAYLANCVKSRNEPVTRP